jgi:hypothetical protein
VRAARCPVLVLTRGGETDADEVDVDVAFAAVQTA